MEIIERKPRLLLIAYFFPPSGGAGSQRPLKFAKYLSELGWDVSVITRTHGSNRTRQEPPDSSLLAELEEITPAVDVKRVPVPLNKKNPYRAWCSAVRLALPSIVQEGPIDAALLTMSPFEMSVLGGFLKEQFSIPVFLDLRDPWALDGWRSYRTYFHWFLDYQRMKKSLRDATGVIANTPESLAAISRLLEGKDQNKVISITNGYDESDFQGSRNYQKTSDQDTFTLLFTGSLQTQAYLVGGSWKQKIRQLLSYRPERIDTSGRTLVHLLEALKILDERGHNVKISVQCIGAFTDADRLTVLNSDASSCVELHPYRSHQEVVKAICEADGLFLPLHGLPAGARSRIVPGKTYEYMASMRPILACVPLGDARDFLLKSGVAYTANPTDPADIADAIAKMVEEAALPNDDVKADVEYIRRYERRVLSVKLHEFLLEMAMQS